MKKSLIIAAALILGTIPAAAQETISYALPSTTINLLVTAECENFVAGPYAAFAQKYLGAEARTSDATTYTLKSVKLVPYLEADPASLRKVEATSEEAATFAGFCSQGLVVMSDSFTGKSEVWRFPSAAPEGIFNSSDLGENLTSATTTLYKNVVNGSSFSRVAVQQSEVVEKSLEKKAKEAADRIFDLRKNRIQIITGDTDATYSGEAMGAAVAEITRLEQEYLSLFFGLSEKSVQTMNFDVIPTTTSERQMYIAFRISDTEGLLPSSNIAGRPVVLEISIESRAEEPAPKPEEATTAPAKKKGPEPRYIHFRVPATTTVRLIDAEKVLLQSRMPIFQLGTELTYPLNNNKKK